jgi:histidyl-tRNA synthetase
MIWADVKKGMVEDKGLPGEVADRIGEYVKHSGGIRDMLQFLKEDAALSANIHVQAGIADMDLLASYLQALRVTDKVSFDLSLARGLDYYTSLIFEVLCKPSPDPEIEMRQTKRRPKGAEESSQVGSIAAGGRYDNLVGMYGKRTIPCVGVSFGVDRIFTILKARCEKEEALRARKIDVYIMAFGGKEFDGLLLERLSIASQLWDAGIATEFMAKVKPKLQQQFRGALDVPLAIILGQDELTAGKVRVKVLGLDNHPEKEGVLVEKADLVAEVQKRLSKLR